MRKILTFMMTLVSSVIVTVIFFQTKTIYCIDDKGVSQNEVSAVADYITVGQMNDFLSTKKEHYPFSDEFIEKYQQEGDGYIKTAKDLGMVVDKTLHLPNQKWHYFESWMNVKLASDPTLADGKASSQIYGLLKCPELLLWIMEACGVSPVKVKAAMDQAAVDKVNKTHISTLASNMKKIVTWDDIETAMLSDGELAPPIPVEKFNVSVNENTAFSVTGLKSSYAVGSSVDFTVTPSDSSMQVKAVTIEGVSVTKISTSKYSFKMPNHDVLINVELEEKTVVTPTPGTSVAAYDIVYDLGDRSTSAPISDASVLFNSFNLISGTNIINGVSQLDAMYGGGYGGSGATKWVMGNMLKFGTQSKFGSMTLSLNSNVNRVVITGYVNFTTCKVQVGDASSTDWLGSNGDGKTATVTCTNMSVVSKEVVEGYQTAQIVIDFTQTSELMIAVLSKGPLYITSIEFLYTE